MISIAIEFRLNNRDVEVNLNIPIYIELFKMIP